MILHLFQKDFSLPIETKLIIGSSQSENAVKNKNGDYLFSLKFSTDDTISFISYLSCILNVFAFFLLIIYLKNLCLAFGNHIGKNNGVFLFLGER